MQFLGRFITLTTLWIPCYYVGKSIKYGLFSHSSRHLLLPEMAPNFQDGMAKIMQRAPLVFALFLGSIGLGTLPLDAALLPSKPATSPLPTPVPQPKIEKHDVLLMNLSINHQLVLTLMSPDGSCRRYLRQDGGQGFDGVLPSKNKGDDFAASSSPDGKWVAYYSSRTGAVNLWICDASGLNQRELTDSDVSIEDPLPLDEAPIQISPDSKRIAYLNGG